MIFLAQIVLLANTPTQIKSLLHSMEQATGNISLHVNADKMEYMCFNQSGNISTLNGGSLNLVDKFTYLGSRISSTKNDISKQLGKELIAINWLSVIWKSKLSNKIKQDFFQVLYSHVPYHNDTIIKPDAMIRDARRLL